MTTSKRAVITGITGQDGSYLAELLLEKGYEVFGVVRRLSAPNVWRIQHLLPRISLLQADLLDQLSLIKAVERAQPHEFYNRAAMSFVPASWDQPMLTGEYNAQGVTRALEAVRSVNPKIRFYQASSSEMYGRVREVPQTEMTPFYPRSPYGVSKVFGHYITVNYRESYDLFACSGILFNHESPRRGETFVTRKITRAVANIKEICESNLKNRYDLEVIDIYQQPVLMKGEQIIAAPTLVKKLPLPLRKFIGDMSDTERILVGLDLRPRDQD